MLDHRENALSKERRQMDFLALARERRSVRAYSDRNVSLEDLEYCVKAAGYSPSACDSQPWRFIIVNDPRLVENISNACSGRALNINRFTREAKAFIVIVTEKPLPAAWLGGKIKKTDFRLVDTGIACAHLTLAACSRGLGSCVIGWFDKKKVKKALNIPAGKKVPLVLALGHPSENTCEKGKKIKEWKDLAGINSY
ncbi:MAG: NAD(P)H nitroreductase [Candidatus Omnitrophica bacterium]|nr:NAD(P)H nitroreductase [Candidatus Omnitrophota bacterium]